MTLPGVSRTAIGVARVRARESARPDRLFDDPQAAVFAALADDASDPSPARRALAFQIVIRTRFYDDWLRDCLDGGVRQVVLLGAGLDTRAWRMAWPEGVRLFEVDLPEVLAVKGQQLQEAGPPRAQRSVVAADLTGDWATPLRAAGFDPAAATAWLAEGLLVYLDEKQAQHVLSTLTSLAAPGSGFATERLGSRAANVAAPDTAAATDLWQGGLGARLEPWLREQGWQTQVHRLDEVAALLGRAMSRESDSGFVVASRLS